MALAFTMCAATVAAQQATPAGDDSRSWDPAAAAAYLDARMDLWFANGTKLKTGDTQTACVSCHAGLAYALSRPVLRRVMHVDTPSTQEARLIDETTRRVETYSTHQVLYDFNERRQIESRGTEAVLNAVILTSADAASNLNEPSVPTKKALARLWETQRADGRWDWLEFGLEPWETSEAVYHGATFAAFAVGTAQGQHDAVATAGIERLRAYLSSNYQAQHLYNRTWALLASTRLKRVIIRRTTRCADRRSRPGAAGRRGMVARGNGPVEVEQGCSAREIARRSRCVPAEAVRWLRHRPRCLHAVASGCRPESRRDPQGYSVVGVEPACGPRD
jgi:hypothetical protein